MALFISLDGVDGAGKTTQAQLLAHWLREQGRDVVACRDPGGTPLGEALRRIVLGGHDLPIHRRSEMLLYMAARAQLVEQVIRPALQAGRTVVSDRYLLANVVYQGRAGGLGAELVWRVGRIATDGILPDVVFVLDLPVEAAMKRLGGRLDRMEAQGEAFLERVRAGYLAEAKARSDIVLIDAEGDAATVHERVRAAAARVMGERAAGEPAEGGG